MKALVNRIIVDGKNEYRLRRGRDIPDMPKRVSDILKKKGYVETMKVETKKAE